MFLIAALIAAGSIPLLGYLGTFLQQAIWSY
jgi:hypothetical protein